MSFPRFILVLFTLLVTFNSAFAQLVQPSGYSGLKAINTMINNTPGVTAVGVTGGVKVGATASEAALYNGLKIPVSVTAQTTVTAARLAGLASTALKVGNVVGVAAIVLPWLAEKSGIVTCAPPKFFCTSPKEGTSGVVAGTWSFAYHIVGVGSYSSNAEVCSVWASRSSALPANVSAGVTWNVTSSSEKSPWRCTITASNGTVDSKIYQPVTACPSGSSLNPASTNAPADSCLLNDGGTAPSPGGETVTDAEVIAAIQQNLNEDAAKNATLYNAMRAQQMDVLQPADQVEITAAPVVVPRVTTTSQLDNGDGTTSTRVIQQDTVITPRTDGTTLAEASLRYPATTTTTTTTTNNTTNVVTTNITTTTGEAPAVDMPTDYNREATQQKILQQLTLDGLEPPVDQQPLVDAAKADQEGKIAGAYSSATGDFTSSKSNWFSWVWTPPVGTCTPTKGVVGGFDVDWDICPTVEKIREVIGFMFAIFAAWSMYNLIFRE